MTPDLEHKLGKALRDHPYKFSNRYDENARTALLEILFRSLTNDRPDYLSGLFPNGFPPSYKLEDAQGTAGLSEYTEAARGHPCGHILKQGEATYNCMTCTDDATCVLCSRCFDASDHEGHQFHISSGTGNSGCCDCGDAEAWKRPVNCAIHTATASQGTRTKDQPSPLPQDLIISIRTTIGRVLDYFCDVISCSPEQLRLPKTEESLRNDENLSRLGSNRYAGGDEHETEPEYCLMIWNDEKHTVMEVSDVIKRACRQTSKFGLTKAYDASDAGRSTLEHSRDLKALIKMSDVVGSINVTTTIRTSRDTFREHMCGTIVEWLSDIAGCSVGDDHRILRYTTCEEMLQEWRIGSEAYNAQIGRSGIDDHEYTESMLRFATLPALLEDDVAPDVTEDDDVNDDEVADPVAEGDADHMDIENSVPEREVVLTPHREMRLVARPRVLEQITDRLLREAQAVQTEGGEIGAAWRQVEQEEAGMIFQAEDHRQEADIFTPTQSDPGDAGSMAESQTMNFQTIPKTPFGRRKDVGGSQPSHWAVRPSGSTKISEIPPHEDLTKNIRLDSMILFDMRLWKKTRIDLRGLYISTVVNVPAFKRILGLRFSGLYTSLSQLYLIADREPDHSIINLSLQMLTSPSITEEVIERGNFLTNLMAILYTFLTSRQVGFPQDVSSSATLAFDTGSVTNRRLYHFFTDLRYFLSSEPVQRRVREDGQYLVQFLDLVKLSQGICPNVRAVGEHVEYETDAWIGASLLTREVNKLCRQFSESFSATKSGSTSSDNIASVIYTSALATIVNCVGLERERFDQNEVKELTRFKVLRPFEFEKFPGRSELESHRVVDFVVETGALSFHHALHYTLSWLIEGGKSMSREAMLPILWKAGSDFLRQYGPSNLRVQGICEPEDALLAMFDFPLRVCAWLAQMKAGLWVRNGMSLRHQMSQYKGVGCRDVGYHRDIFLLQTAFVTCEPGRLLATMIDRFGLDDWMRGTYDVAKGYEDLQVVDIVGDFIYLLIMILSDRASLIPLGDEPNPLLAATRKDVIHALCFKPLSFSDLNTKLNEKAQEYQALPQVLEEIATFRAPEGLTDSGTFELKPEYLEDLDPYSTNYTKNQRDEAENIYKKWMSKKINKPTEEIVLEPKLRPIPSGLFKNLPSFTSHPLFAQIIYYVLKFALVARTVIPDIPATRVESLLQMTLQLALIATLEDDTTEDDFTEESMQSFIRHALTASAATQTRGHDTIIEVLQQISNMDEYTPCRPKIKHMLKLFYRKRAHDFNQSTAHLDFPFGRIDTASPANGEQELEAKKRQALERKAKIMAQFQQQQKNFMEKQRGSDWREEDLSDIETEAPLSSERKVWKYPSGVCILCQEDTNGSRLYGTFGMFTESNVLRQTDLEDSDRVEEALDTPENLDRSIEHLRPFGVSGKNREQVVRLSAEGNQIIAERQGLGKGWPAGFARRTAISTGCGHLMHYVCFDHYLKSVKRRHAQQIARHHPERMTNNEFVCPLCKALGNTFLPILWKEKEESYPGALAHEESLESFLDAEAYRILPLQLSLEQSNFDSGRSPRTSFLGAITAGFNDAMLKAVSFGRSMNPPTSRVESSTAELLVIFSRLRDTITSNRLDRSQAYFTTAKQVSVVDALLSLMGSSVSAVEIAQRGVSGNPGSSTLVERTSAQTLSHLRVLSETIKMCVSIGDHYGEPSVEELSSAQKRLFRELFVRSASALTNDKGMMDQPSVLGDRGPLLLQDIFDVFSQSCFVLSPTLKIDIHHLLHLCYLAQIIQVVMAYMYNPGGWAKLMERQRGQGRHSPQSTLPTEPEVHALSTLTEWMSEKIYASGYMPGNPPEGSQQMLFILIRSYSLAFLRKATIYVYVNHGVDFPSSSDYESSELDRLSQLLKLPTLHDILSDFQPYSGKQSIKDQVSEWILSLARYQHSKQAEGGHHIPRMSTAGPGDRPAGPLIINLSRHMSLPHPAPFELIGLPQHFDVLMEEANRRKCPSTGKDLTDPTICLFCGAIFCSQAVCCMQNDIGPATRHATKCSYPLGVFLSIRKCMVLFLHMVAKPPPKPLHNAHHHHHLNSSTTAPSSSSASPTSSNSSAAAATALSPISSPPPNGSWFYAPYLTRHGEVDPGLRQRHQLVLNQKRYDRLVRDVVLMTNGNLWSMVARKLEAEINVGGWESI